MHGLATFIYLKMLINEMKQVSIKVRLTGTLGPRKQVEGSGLSFCNLCNKKL